MKKITITVAGERGAGKSTIAEAIRRHLSVKLSGEVDRLFPDTDLSDRGQYAFARRLRALHVDVDIIEQQLPKGTGKAHQSEKHEGAPQPAEGDETLNLQDREWPAHIRSGTFQERAAYKQGLTDAREMMLNSMKDVLPIMNNMGWYFDDRKWHKIPDVHGCPRPLAFLSAEEQAQLMMDIETDILANVARRLSRDEDARLSVIDPDSESAWHHAATVNVHVPILKVREILADQLRTQLEDVESVMAAQLNDKVK